MRFLFPAFLNSIVCIVSLQGHAAAPTPIATPATPQAKPANPTSPKTATPTPIASPVSTPAPAAALPPPVATPTPQPAPIAKATAKAIPVPKGPRLAFKINLNLSRGNASTAVRTVVNLAKGESTIIGGLMRTMCQDDVCPPERPSCPQKCETLHEDIKMTLTEFKNDVVHCRFEIVGPLPSDHIGFVVTGKVFTTLSFNLQGDLKAKLLLTPSLL